MSQSKKTKKLVNTRESCVRDSLEGYVAVHPGLQILKDVTVVIREDYEDLGRAGSEKVALISGGGSGHEPSHAGFVGQGMLTAAVAGDLFASPPAKNILHAIRTVNQNNRAGTLLIVKNYSGDRLNFGIASERAKQENINVETVFIGEDCAIEDPVEDSPGSDSSIVSKKRGLCGTILVHKIAGALAENGEKLGDIKRKVDEVVKDMATVNLCVYPGSLPGEGPFFHLPSTQVELGLGIHGEAGRQKKDLKTADVHVKEMIKMVMNATKGNPSNKVVLVVNNLGGTSNLELGIVSKCAIETLSDDYKCDVVRAYCGTFMTSLDMAGISLTVLKISDKHIDVLDLLDQETTAPAWPRICKSSTTGARRNKLTAISPPVKERPSHPPIQALGEDIQKKVLSAIIAACDALVKHESQLNELDRVCGDADCGSTFRRGAENIKSSIEAQGGSPFSAYQIAFMLSEIAEGSMGGTSGALYSLFFTDASIKFKDIFQKREDPNTFKALTAAFKAGTEAIKCFGGADRGGRSMVDPLLDICEALDADSEGTDILQNVAKKAEVAAAKTATMRAKVGRASFVNADLVGSKPDAGACAVAIWMRAIAEDWKANP